MSSMADIVDLRVDIVDPNRRTAGVNGSAKTSTSAGRRTGRKYRTTTTIDKRNNIDITATPSPPRHSRTTGSSTTTNTGGDDGTTTTGVDDSTAGKDNPRKQKKQKKQRRKSPTHKQPQQQKKDSNKSNSNSNTNNHTKQEKRQRGKYKKNVHNTPDHLQTHLRGIYGHAMRRGKRCNVTKYCREVFGDDEYSSYYQSLIKHWHASGLADDLNDEFDSHGDGGIVAYTITKYLQKLERKKNNRIIMETEPTLIGAKSTFTYCEVKPEGHSQNILTPCEEELFSQVAEALGNMAFNLDRNHMRSIIDIYLMNTGMYDSDCNGISETTLSRILKKYHLTTTTKTNVIDVARAVQHSTAVLEAYFKIFDNVVHRCHLNDSTKCPWKRWRDIPPQFIYNYDEIGPNPNKHHAPSIVSIETLLQKKMVWQNSSTGDNTPSYHVTVGVTTNAAGLYHSSKNRTSGAAGPFFWVSQDSAIDELEGLSKEGENQALWGQSSDDGIDLPSSLVQEVLNMEGSTNEDINPCGINLRVSKKGSIHKSSFLDYIMHFIKSLPPGQGPNGKTVFLVMDYHGSRANPAAVEYARQHNVVILILPSKTSITSQPNDNSINMVYSHIITRNCKRENMFSTTTMPVATFTRSLVESWNELIEGELDLLNASKINKAMRGFIKTGLWPLNYDCERWTEAIQFYSTLAEIERKRAEADGVDVTDNTWTIRARDDVEEDLPQSEVDILIAALPVCRHYNYTSFPHRDLANYVLSFALNNYINDTNRDRDSPPPATTTAETIALKLMKYELASMRVNTDPPTEQEQNESIQNTELCSLRHHRSVKVKNKANGITYTCIKLERDEFMVSQNRHELLNTEQVLLQYTVLETDATISREEKTKIARRSRRERQNEERLLEMDAKEEAKVHRMKEIYFEFNKRLSSYTNDDGETPDDALIEDLIKMCHANYQETIICFHPETNTKTKFDVSLTGFDVHASSAVAQKIIIECLGRKKASGGNNKQRGGRRRVVSTKRGEDLGVAAMHIQRNNQQEEINGCVKDIARLKKELRWINQAILVIKNHIDAIHITNTEANPFDFATITVKPKVRDQFAFILKIPNRTKLSAGERESAIRKFSPDEVKTKYDAMVDTVDSIRETINNKEDLLQQLIPEQEEEEDNDDNNSNGDDDNDDNYLELV